MKKTLVIMAAGIGNRYGGLKQMEPIGPSGEFIIDYSVYDAMRAGFNRVVFIIRNDIEQDFKTTIGGRVEKHIETSYAFQELDDLPDGVEANPNRAKPWGTVQAILACRGLLDGPFAVINADDFYGKDSYCVLSQFLDTNSPDNDDYSIVGFKLGNTLSIYGGVTRGICKSGENDELDTIVETSGICCDSDGRIYVKDPIESNIELKGDELVSMNMWGFTPSVLEFFEEEFQIFLRSNAKDLQKELVIPTAVSTLIEKGKATVKVLSTSSNWFGITYPDDRDEVIKKIQKLIQTKQYPDNLWKNNIPTTAKN